MPLLDILLPFCEEIDIDVFLHVLKDITARKLNEHYLVNALKYGISGEAFSVDEQDLTSWKDLNSNEQRINQSRLLGLWAKNNFPSLGRQLHGALWQPSTENNLLINNQPKCSDEIDEIIFKKLKLRVLQLNISDSTLTRLKEFVIVPANIGRKHETKISKQMKSFDIHDEWLEYCWKALKSGEFPTQQVGIIASTGSLPHRENEEHQKNSENESISVASKRAYLDILDTNDGNDVDNVNRNSSNGLSSVQISKRAHMDAINVTRNFATVDAQSVLTPQTNGNGTGDYSTHAIQAVLYNIRNDISHLTNLFEERHTGTFAVEEGQNLLHAEIMKKKDDEIANLKVTIKELRQMNEGLTNDQSNSMKQIKEQNAQITSLQAALDTTTKLHEESERDNIANRKLVDSMNGQLTESAQIIQKLVDELNKTNESKQQMNEEIQQLRQMNEVLTNDQSNSMKQIKEQNAQITSLQAALDTTTKLHEESERDNIASRKLADSINGQLTESAQTIQNLVDELNKTNESKQNLYAELSYLNQCATEMSSEFQNKIEKLEAKIAATESIHAETSRVSMKLQEDLAVAQQNLASKQTELKDVQGELSETQKPIETSDKGSQTIESKADVFEKTNCTHDPIDQSHSESANIDSVEIECKPGCSVEGAGRDAIELGFASDDPIVQRCRPVLLKQKFGWMKFQAFKRAKYQPGFVYQADSDGSERAQKIKADGYITDKKNIFFDFQEELPEALKHGTEKLALKRFNVRFGLSFK